MEIVIFAMLAGYLFFRLWSVLGTRTGNEKGFDESRQQRFVRTEEDNIIVLPKQTGKGFQTEETGSSLQKELQKLKEANPDFEERAFLRAAEKAFILIIKAYSQGNLKILRNLLDEPVYEQFRLAVEDRNTKGLTQEVEIDSIHSELVTIEVFDKKAQITVRFKSEQMNATFNQQGENTDNPARIKIPVVDIWTFERPLRFKTPTWLLVRTSTDTLN